MLSTSKNANKNYLAKVVKLKGVKKHPNADRLQTVEIDFNTVITGMEARDGDYYVYFPVESKINQVFLAETNSFSDKLMNVDQTKKGYFGDKGRVKATRLRGEKSMGYIVPLITLIKWAGGKETDFSGEFLVEGAEFDTIFGIKVVEKYQVKGPDGKVSKAVNVGESRLIDGQVHLHVDTNNLRRNAHKIGPDDLISITYKTHGTSWWVGNLIVKRKLKFWEKVGKFLGFDMSDLKYDLIYGSRRVVKNKTFESPKKDGYDLWEGIKDEIGHLIPKGYTLYGEMLGYDANGKAIQKGYDYGCDPLGNTLDYKTALTLKPQYKLEVYRITYVNYDGKVQELSYPQIVDFCNKHGLTPAHQLFYGKAIDWYMRHGNIIPSKKDPNSAAITASRLEFTTDKFIKSLEDHYNEKDCFMCNNKVPEEGIVVRKENLYSCESYKLKSFRFLEWESKELDKGVSDVESSN